MTEGFYNKLTDALEKYEGDIWTETVLDGENAGEKRLLTGTAGYFRAGDKVASADCTHRVFCERVGRIPKLVICGAGHVSMPVVRMGKMLGFTVTVLEDRPKFADNARTAGADSVLCEPFHTGLTEIKGDSDTWFVIVTRGHRYDTECLEEILKKQHAYVGMMGSRRRVAIVKEQLAKKGTDRVKLESVHTPIGLEIGAQTPEEIAVSIMAEIIQVKNNREKSGGYSKEILAAPLDGESRTGKAGGCGKECSVSGAEQKEKKVLATIISRKGSAPRDVGTKMLILEDGSTVDTIGGGCVESEIIQKALLMMRAGKPDFQICSVDMTSEAAEDEGMVCGGVVEVMLEYISRC